MFYEVEAKCGHVGKSRYILKSFPVEAHSAAEAASKVRFSPRVKHHHPDAIRQVQVIDAPRYWELVAVHKADPYFACHSIQEQRRLCPNLDLLPEAQASLDTVSKRDACRRNVYVGKKKIRNPKKYINYYCDCEDNVA